MEAVISQMNKLFTKPLMTGLTMAGVSVFNIAVFGQATPGAPEIAALEWILKIIGGFTLLVITGVNVWAAIKNKNYAELKESNEIKQKLIDSLKLANTELEKEKAEETTDRQRAERELKRRDDENEKLEKENLRLKGKLKLKGEIND